MEGVGADFNYCQRQYDKNNDNKITSAEYNFRWDYPKYDRDKDGFVTRDEFDALKRFMGQSRNALFAIRPGGEGDVTQTHVKWQSTSSLPGSGPRVSAVDRRGVGTAVNRGIKDQNASQRRPLAFSRPPMSR